MARTAFANGPATAAGNRFDKDTAALLREFGFRVKRMPSPARAGGYASRN